MIKQKQTDVETGKIKKDQAEDKTVVRELPEFPEDYERQVFASFMKFELVGDSINGKLMAISKSKRWDFNLYTIRIPSGDMIRCHGTQQLDQLMIRAEEGDNVFISFIDETETPNGTMKIFDVGIQKKRNTISE